MGWREGTYIVYLKNYVAGIDRVRRGDIAIIQSEGGVKLIKDDSIWATGEDRIEKGDCKWFGTLYEAEKHSESIAGHVPNQEEKDKLLAYAKLNYPIGTKYLDQYGYKKEVKGGFSYHENVSFYSMSKHITDGYGGSVWKDEIWAEIVENSDINENLNFLKKKNKRVKHEIEKIEEI